MLAPTNMAAEKMAATAAEMLLETFENILISFRLEPVFRIIAKMPDTLHGPCQFTLILVFQLVDRKNHCGLNDVKLIIGDIPQILAFLLRKPNGINIRYRICFSSRIAKASDRP